MKKALMTMLLGTLLAATSVHGSDQSKYESLVLKYAIHSGKVGKTACICDGTFTVGWLEMTAVFANGSIGVQCAMPGFFPDGSISGLGYCTAFRVLAK